MDLEEQTLHYYLKVFSLLFLIILSLLYLYIHNILNKKVNLNNNLIKIEKGEKTKDIFHNNINNLSILEIEIINFYIKINNIINNNFIHYGEFKINNNATFIELINIFSQPSNVLKKITIVEGWSQKQLDIELSKYFNNFKSIPYKDIIADTYFIKNNGDFNFFYEKLKKIKKNYFKEFEKNKLLLKFSNKEIKIIGSLMEKEGLDKQDMKKIYSVIQNRLNKKMKLQIDATVLYSITNGEYNLNRKLLISDLKVKNPYNTYLYKGLPPEPISYVGKKTLDIVFENYKSDFLFYFYNKSLKRHVFSTNYKEHITKLNEYRKGK